MALCKQHIGKIRKEYSMNKKNNIILCVVAVLIACVFLFPLYWIIVNSFKLDSEIFASTPTLWPKEFTLKAYQEQFGILCITVMN